MLRLTLDIVPFGIEEKKRNIYTIEIYNVGPSGIDHLYDKDGVPRYSYGVRTIDEEGNRTHYGTIVNRFDRRQPAHILVNEVCKKLQEKGVFDNDPAPTDTHVEDVKDYIEAHLVDLEPEFSKAVDDHFWELINIKTRETD